MTQDGKPENAWEEIRDWVMDNWPIEHRDGKTAGDVATELLKAVNKTSYVIQYGKLDLWPDFETGIWHTYQSKKTKEEKGK